MHQRRPLDLLLVLLLVILAASTGTEVAGEDLSEEGLDRPARFSEHLLARDYAYPYGIDAGDIDGDGDLDLTSADYQPHNNLHLFENLGAGRFARHLVQSRDGRRLERHRMGDVDGDGDLDIVIVKNLYGHVLWFENHGSPTDGQLWQRHVVTTVLPGAYNVDLADFDGDGDLDVAASSWVLGNQFAWFENNVKTAEGEWQKRIIEKDLAETRGLRVADFNGDRVPDLLATAPEAGQVIWYENSGQPRTEGWTKHLIDRTPRPMHGDAADVDGDGDPDVVLAVGMRHPEKDPTSHHIVWYENPADSKHSWTRHVIDAAFSDAFEAQAADLDGDGSVDVAATSWRKPGRVAWFESLGKTRTGSAAWRRHTLKNNWQSANNLLIADLSGDALPDIAAVAEHGSYELRWWRNEGGTPPDRSSITELAGGVTRTIAHQGARAVRPPNTLAGVRYALATGVTTIEVDVRSTRDGALVVHHDATLEGHTNGEGLLSSATLSELRKLDAGASFAPEYSGERIPTLREVLELCRDRVEILLDLKESSPRFHEALAREVRAYGNQGRTLLGVRTLEQAQHLRSLLGGSPQLGLIPGAGLIEEFARAGVQTIRLKGAWLRGDAVARVHASGVALHLNGGTGARDEVRRLLAYGPDSVSADHPGRLADSIRSLRGETSPPHSVAPPRLSASQLRMERRRAAWRTRRIIMNNDGNDALAPAAGTPRTRQSFLAARTAPLVGSQVDAIFYSTGSFGLYKHHSGVTELLKNGTRGQEDWAWELGRHGPDALATMTHFAHRHGMELFWSMRMNDTHDTKYDAVMSRWKRDHPELLVGERGTPYPYGRCRWQGRWSSLDYGHAAVRDRAYRILQDVATRYDVDGIELDFFRHPVYFKAQMTGEPVTDRDRALMTSLVRRVRALANEQTRRRGRPLLLAIRVPDSLGYSRAIGLDVERWLAEDLIDLVTGGGYFHLEEWESLAEIGRRYDVPVYACLSASRLGFPTSQADRFNQRKIIGLERWRGEAARAWKAGVSGIYIFNCFDPRDPVFRELGDPKLLASLEQVYRPEPGELDHWVKGGERFARLTSSPPAVEAAPLTIETARIAVTGHDVNRPDPFPGLGKFGWPGNITRLADGTLAFVHTAGYYHVSFAEPRDIEPETRRNWLSEGWPLDTPAPTGGRSMISFSDDEGRTWSKPRTIIDLRLDDGSYGLLRLRSGTLLCFINVQASWYGYRQAPPGFEKDIDGLNTKQCLVRSTDGGRTWSKPIWLDSPANFYERSHAQPIELPDGGIVWPCYGVSQGTREYAILHRSDDDGLTWRVLSTVRREGKLVDEPAIARLDDGRLLLVCRPDGGVFHSSDTGVTWRETGRIVNKGRFKAPRLFVLEDGTVVCVATLGTLHVFLSNDAGESWTPPIPLDKSSYGYPGGVLLEDESLLISYCSSGRAPNRLYVVRFRVNKARNGIELLPIGR